MAIHICPVCGKTHAVRPSHQAVAYGRQLRCYCACELEHRRRVRRQLLAACATRRLDRLD